MANPHGKLFFFLLGSYQFCWLVNFVLLQQTACVILFLQLQFFSSKSFEPCFMTRFWLIAPIQSRNFQLFLHLIISRIAFSCHEYCLQCYLDLFFFLNDMVFVPIQSQNFHHQLKNFDLLIALQLLLSLIALQVGQQMPHRNAPPDPLFLGGCFFWAFRSGDPFW